MGRLSTTTRSTSMSRGYGESCASWGARPSCEPCTASATGSGDLVKRRLGLRGRLTAIVLVAAIVTVGALVAGFNFALRASLDHDANQVLAGRAAAAIDAVKVGDGRVRSVEAPDQRAVDAQTWVFSGRRTLERPPAPPAVQAAARSLAGGPR